MNVQVEKQRLQALVRSGESVTQEDVTAAYKVADKLKTTETSALYGVLKNRLGDGNNATN